MTLSKIASKIKILILFILILNFSCNQKNENLLVFTSSLNSSKRNKIELHSLSGEKVQLNHEIKAASKIRAIDGKLYVLTKSKNGYVKAFDLQGKYQGAYFNSGSGPGEVLLLTNFGFLEEDGISYLYGNDIIQNKMVFISPNDTLDTKFKGILFQAIPISDKAILGVPIEEEKMFGYFNFSGELIKSFEEFPKSEITDQKYILSQAFLGCYDYHRQNNAFVVASHYTDRILLFSDIGNTEKKIEIRGPLFYEPIFKVGVVEGEPVYTLNKESRLSFTDVLLTNNEIIVLYSGYTFGEPQSRYATKIFIFDYQGNVIKGFEVNEKLKSITYDQGSQTLYGLDTSSSEDESIIKYSLN